MSLLACIIIYQRKLASVIFIYISSDEIGVYIDDIGKAQSIEASAIRRGNWRQPKNKQSRCKIIREENKEHVRNTQKNKISNGRVFKETL